MAATGRRGFKGRLAVWREHHGWCLRASMQRLAARPLGSLLTAIVMGFALALPLALWWVAGNVRDAAGTLGTTPAVNVFLKLGTAQDALSDLVRELRARPGVTDVDVRTPDDGWRELAAARGLADLGEVVGDNPLPYALIVHLGTVDAAQVKALTGWIAARPDVDQVQDDSIWRQRLDRIASSVHRTALALSILVALAAVLVVGNSIRLDIQGRADELGVLRLVGAGNAFVRRPFLYAGVWYGLAGALVAIGLVAALEWFIAAPVRELVASYQGRLEIQSLDWPQAAAVLAAGVVLGWLGARLVSGYYLRRSD